MAKKTTSYEPNLGLIAGERAVAESLTDPGATMKAFGQAFSQTIALGMLENEKRDAALNKHLDYLGGVGNISMIDDATNKQAITNFVSSKRDEYAALAAEYEKTKDRGIKDKMEAIKFSFTNLNNQLKGFTEEKVEYLKAADERQLADATTYNNEYYTNAFTDNGTFGIDENGNISHTINGTSYAYKQEGGKWNVKNNEAETYILTEYDKYTSNGAKGQEFFRDNVRNGIRNNFKNTGTEGIQVMATTDLTGDDNFLLADGETMAGNLSFRELFAGGMLDEKFYRGFDADDQGKYNVDWMMDDAQGDKLNNLMAEYYTDVMESGHAAGKETYKPKGGLGGGDDDTINMFGTTYNAPSMYGNSKARYQKELSNIQAITDGNEVTIGNDIYNWDETEGKYKQTYVRDSAGRTTPVDYPERYSKRDLVERQGGYYSRIPEDYEFDDEIGQVYDPNADEQADPNVIKQTDKVMGPSVTFQNQIKDLWGGKESESGVVDKLNALMKKNKYVNALSSKKMLFTQEDMWNKYTIGFGGEKFVLTNPDDYARLIKLMNKKLTRLEGF